MFKDLKEDFRYWYDRYTYNDDEFKVTIKGFLSACWRHFYGWTPIFKLRMIAQRLLRANHLSDLENWECFHYMSRDILRRLRAFKKMERHGYPHKYSENDDDDPNYDEARASGKIVGGGPDAWERDINEMILGFEYVAEVMDDLNDSKKSREWYIKNYGESPYEQSDSNIKQTKINGKDHTFYMNNELLNKIDDDYRRRLRLFGEMMTALWD
jgi:hypothetical protein